MPNTQHIPRRQFLQTASSAAAAVALKPRPGDAGETPARRPNVVFLLADQWRAQATGYAGDPNLQTPHLDHLARQSVNFTNAVSACPVCSPYRGSLMTGQYPLTHGVFLNDVCLSSDAVSLAEAFKTAGYHTGYIGKWHLDGHGRSSYIPPERRQGFQYWRANECTHNYNKSLYYADDPEKLFWKGYDAIDQTEDARRYLREHRDEPFALVLSWGPPHNPYETAPEAFQRRFRPEDIQLRPNVPDEAAEAARRDLAGYYAHCAALDVCVGRIVEELNDLRLADDTILVFTSDHGDMIGSQGNQRKQRPWDESIRVPFLLRYPRLLGAGAKELTLPINTPDIMPTLLGLCGIDAPQTAEGTDRTALVTGTIADGDEPALITCPSPFGEWTREKGGREYRGLRTRRYTYVRTLDGPWLLYDNQTDPYQMNNLVGQSEHAALQADLEAMLAARLEQTTDQFLPGEQYVARWGYQTDANGTVPYRN
jgi:arylsulfatase A-like enzyme